MKLFTLLFVLSAVVLYVKSEDFTVEGLIKARADCMKTVDNSELNTEGEPKCYNSCLMKKFDLMDSDGKLHKVVALKAVKIIAQGDAELEKKGIDMVETCSKHSVPAENCEAANEYEICMKNTGYKVKV